MKSLRRRIPKTEGYKDLKIPPFLSDEIFELFKEKGGIYTVAQKNGVKFPNNLYKSIKRCDRHAWEIQKLLDLIGYTFYYEFKEGRFSQPRD